MRYQETLVSYELKSNFLALMGVPLIIVQVYSNSQVFERNRMLVEGSSLVRLANGLLVKKGKKPDFILMAIYFNDDSSFNRYLIYQDETRVCGHVIYMVPNAERTRWTRCCIWEKHSITRAKTGFGWFMKCIIWSHNGKWLKETKWSRRTCSTSHRWTVAWMLSQQQRRQQGDDRKVGDIWQDNEIETQ